MNKNKSNSDKIPMDDLFRDAFSDHKEPTDEKDFDQFLQQLEETGYFNKKRRRPFFFILFFIAGGILTFFLFNPSNSNKEKESNPLVKEKSINAVNDSTDLKNDPIVPMPVSKEEEKVYKSDKKMHTAGSVEEMKNESVTTRNPEILQEKDLPAFKKDSVQVQDVSPKKKVNKDSVRVKYVMQVDTIKTVDSLNIKKRKWDKMKKK